MSDLERFIKERFTYLPGVTTLWSDFIVAFQSWVELNGVTKKRWSKEVIAREFPRNEKFPKGKMGGGNKVNIGNCSIYGDMGEEETNKICIRKKDRLVMEVL